MSLAYPSTLRLQTKSDFDKVFERRNRLYGRYFFAYYRSNILESPRLGIIVAKRNLKRAVQRNRVKRNVREQFRLAQKKLPSLDIVFIAKRGLEQIENKELALCIRHLLKRLAIAAEELQ